MFIFKTLRNLVDKPFLLSILPIIAFLPLSYQFISGFNSGGVPTLFEFFKCSINPDLTKSVLSSSFYGLLITFLIAFLSWSLSSLLGFILGIISSNKFWIGTKYLECIGGVIRLLLGIPRGLHEIIWGLLLLELFGMNIWISIIAIVIPYTAINARVISEQIDSLESDTLVSISLTGTNNFISFINAIIPKITPKVYSYLGYRFECSLRGATLLGVFGLGGIGTELNLSARSLQFREMWTSIWILWLTIIIVEESIKLLSEKTSNFKGISMRNSLFISSLIILFTLINFKLINVMDINTFIPIEIHNLITPSIAEFKDALTELNWYSLISSTLQMTLIATGIAISTPIILALILPRVKVQSIILSFLRLIPIPITTLLILLINTPSISIGALAIGLNNIGVMGRLLRENISESNDKIYKSLISSGSNIRVANMYANIIPQSKSYLAYSAYRLDVILRETTLVGAVGGAGLGWQLQESISSFNWAEIILVSITYILLTVLGESITSKAIRYWSDKSQNNINILSCKN